VAACLWSEERGLERTRTYHCDSCAYQWTVIDSVTEKG